MSELITADALHQILAQPDVCVFDASWYLPSDARDVHAEFTAAHIPGAQFFDFDKQVCLPDTTLPHMLPTPAQFSEHARRLGVSGAGTVVVYDTHGCFSAPRAWWMFRAMGHTRCFVLDGGFPAWREAGFELESGPPLPVAKGDFKATLQPGWLASQEDVLAALDAESVVVVDARPEGRFAGRDAEPRAGLRRGHAPGSVNIPGGSVCEHGRLRNRASLEQAFVAHATTSDRLIASCGSGVTACIIALAARESGWTDVAVYDGSWAEWGAQSDLPVETTKA